jgi:hypothetical protein
VQYIQQLHNSNNHVVIPPWQYACEEAHAITSKLLS